MDSSLKRISTVGMPQADWLAQRQNGIGGSEISAVMGLNPYQSSIELFYKKLGEIPEPDCNIAMFMGSYMEEHVATLWSYYEEDQNMMIKNYNENKQVQKCRKLNAIIINPLYPQLLANIDRIIQKDNSGEEQILEIKTMSGFAAKMWEAGIPPYHLIQLQGYLLVTGLKRGQLAILIDGRNLEVYHFARNEEIIEGIIDSTSKFWERVITARKFKAKGLLYEYLEPEPDQSEAYAKFLSKKYTAKQINLPATNEMYQLGLKYLNCNTKMDFIESEQIGYSNIIKKNMAECDTIDFGADGKITWKADKNGKRSFKVGLKI